jgi:hypothetical protein
MNSRKAVAPLAGVATVATLARSRRALAGVCHASSRCAAQNRPRSDTAALPLLSDRTEGLRHYKVTVRSPRHF